MSWVNKVKEWLKIQMKNKKFVITTIVFLVLLVAVVFGLTISFSGILGSAYDVDSIGKNIDKIKIGDTINYTANGYSDWEVLNINKEDNTIEIVSKESTEAVTITCEADTCNGFYDILQKTANKYLDGKYAVSARSVGEDDMPNIDRDKDYWISKKSDSELYYNNGKRSFKTEIALGYIVPVVVLNVGDSSLFNIGDDYVYSLHDIDEWIVLYRSGNNSIAMVPKKAKVIDFSSMDYGVHLCKYIEHEIQKYKDENVISVESIPSHLISNLSSINYGGLNSKYSQIYSSNCDAGNSTTISYSNGTGIAEARACYNNRIYYRDYNTGQFKSTSSTTQYCVKTFTTGFRPVVTIKYTSEEKKVKDKNDKLEVGDYVKYSANAYNNWKVLNIDKENDTVDIISGGIVKNITLEGKEDYKDLSSILQKEVDAYKNSNDVISARTIQIDDLDALRQMKDTLSVRYFLNDKTKYKAKDSEGNYMSIMAYVVGVASYDSSVSDISNNWAILEYEEFIKDETTWSTAVVGAYKYTAGLRPIITLKLSEVEEIKDLNEVVSSDKTNNNLVKEQNKANESSKSIVKDNQIEEDSIVREECNCSSAGCCSVSGNSIKYQPFAIILIIINILLTVLAFSIEKIKFWIKRQSKRKMVISSGVVLSVLAVTTVFGLTFNISKIMGSVYDIDNISSNINDIQIGDSINYTANGYNDWEVININKEDNTIDIISRTIVGDVTIPCVDEKCSDYYDVLQQEANKYLDGKYAISARSVREDDLFKLPLNTEYSRGFWLAKRTDSLLYYLYMDRDSSYVGYGIEGYNYGDITLGDSTLDYSIVPVVTIEVLDSSLLNVGDVYTYSLNGIEEWLVLYKDSSTSISIIPKTPQKTDLRTNRNGTNIQNYISGEIEKYKTEGVISVRSVSSSDIDALNSIDYYAIARSIYTGNFIELSTSEQSQWGRYKSLSTSYKNELLSGEWNSTDKKYYYSVSSKNYTIYSYVSGFRPVVTIKYSNEERSGKDLKDELEVGDYVKYSANGYNNWKVLNIDKKKGTVDIISGGLVRNITLEGKDNYDNLDTILQEEVDKYKVGEYAVSARSVELTDFDNLREMKDTLTAKYFLNDKIKYWSKGTENSYASGKNIMVYAVGLGYYDSKSAVNDYDWALLENEYFGENTSDIAGSYNYTAGLRPIITLKLYEVEKEELPEKFEDVTDEDEALIDEQNKANQTVQKPINNIDINKDMIVSDDKDNNKIDSVVESAVCECDSIRDCSDEAKINGNGKIIVLLVIFNIILLVLIIVFNLLGIRKKKCKVSKN